MIHAKHEAFRFKFEPKATIALEKEISKGQGYVLYANAIIYYIIMFVCPVTFVYPCGEGINPVSHIIYASYAFFNGIFEIATAIHIKKKLQKALAQDEANDRDTIDDILSFNRWHVVEFFMGQIARFDTYLDVCFLTLLI
eukprot:CAMPEP_0116873898 /NCGR_PEP_ID=MMETSP0463-20121206/5234_1 /TAXON_ID=181622 /ORGANISM="Strombidinopsis sp, Strain SopsisLIS2011" /LENGTH=139 /DNA_ID=CAMNT_0004516751 /DNA_START=707 /DNA_END=1126 /DNA_ORIENTATION=+